MNAPDVKPEDRWTKDNRCPNCGGHQHGNDDEHCWGYQGANGPYCNNQHVDHSDGIWSESAEAWLHSDGVSMVPVSSNGHGSPTTITMPLVAVARQSDHVTIDRLCRAKGIRRELLEDFGCHNAVGVRVGDGRLDGVMIGSKLRVSLNGEPKYVVPNGNKVDPLFPRPPRRMNPLAAFTAGETDMLVMRQAGFDAYSITMGERRKGALTVAMWTELRKRDLRNPLIAYDADVAGKEAIEADVRNAQAAGLQPAVVDLSPWYSSFGDRYAKDVGELWLHVGCDTNAFLSSINECVVMRVPRRTLSVVSGASVLDSSDQIDCVWGKGTYVLWSYGEPLMLVAPDGRGKTGIAQQLALFRIGLYGPDESFLGFPVPAGNKKVLYLALDRPAQAQRSLRRMITDDDREILHERLVIWNGHLPFDLETDRRALAEFAHSNDADTVIIDQVKDAVVKMSDEDIGEAFNYAVQECVQTGVEVCSLHIPRKGKQGENKPPASLDDIYGSRLLKQGHGSVLSLWSQSAGDHIVTLTHLKQPGDPVGPLQLKHDKTTGETRIYQEITAKQVARENEGEITAKSWAQAKFKKERPNRNEIEIARRELEAKEADGNLECIRRGQRGGKPTAWIETDA